jgi:hypothetical protein
VDFPSVTCYPTPGKSKALKICEAFAEGARAWGLPAEICLRPPRSLRPGAAVFYGVTIDTQHLWREAQSNGRHWYYADNSYFDCVRGTHFRVTRNALQATGQERPDFPRFEALQARGLTLKPWREEGEHIALIMQSDAFMRVLFGYKGAKEWCDDVLSRLHVHTLREIRVRAWDPDKRAQAATLDNAFKNAWALVTHTSAAANEAVLRGIPVFLTGPCAALAMGSSDLSRIAAPSLPWARTAWAAALAGLQWTIEEIASGVAWAALNREVEHA